MNKRYELAIFDLDGTLLDTSEGIIASVQETIRENHLHPLTDEQLRTFIGPPMEDSFAKHFDTGREKAAFYASVFRRHYRERHLFAAVLYPGIHETMEELKKRGVIIGAATYKRQDYAVDILKHFGFDRYSSLLYGSDPEGKMKKPDIIRKCINDSPIRDDSKAVMIGDSSHDALGAQAAGIDFIGVTYGFGFRDPADVAQFPHVGAVSEPSGLLAYFERK